MTKYLRPSSESWITKLVGRSTETTYEFQLDLFERRYKDLGREVRVEVRQYFWLEYMDT